MNPEFTTDFNTPVSFPKISVQVKKLEHFKGDLPVYQTSGASGFDLRAQINSQVVIPPGQRGVVSTGLSFAIPEGFEMQIRPRSGLALKKGVMVLNTPGTIDSDYRGELQIILANLSNEEFVIQDQDRIAQGVICPVFHAEWSVVQELAQTLRGKGGFGHTGVS